MYNAVLIGMLIYYFGDLMSFLKLSLSFEQYWLSCL